MNEIISQNIDLVIIGAGPAGLAAAINAKKNGIKINDAQRLCLS